jgi:hypothetical protein
VSLEYFPDNKISFNDLFDGRLERFGFTTAAEAAALIAPDGTTTIVRRTDQGHAQFPREIPVVIRNAIATEFCTDLLRWGEATLVLVEGPSCVDAECISRWFDAAMACDRVLQQHFRSNPEFRKSISRLELEYCIAFAPAATTFVRKWLKDRHSFHLNLRDSPWAEIFSIMVGIGFFTRTGDHYQMTIPAGPELDRITESLLQLAETEDAKYYLHPERHLIAMTRYRAKCLRELLRMSDKQTRLDDREKLLAA